MDEVERLVQDMTDTGFLQRVTDDEGKELGFIVTDKGWNAWCILDKMREEELKEMMRNLPSALANAISRMN